MTLFYWSIDYIASFVEFAMCGIFGGIFLSKHPLGERKYDLYLWSGIGALLNIIVNRANLFSYISVIIAVTISILIHKILYSAKIGISFLITIVYTLILSGIDFMTCYLAMILLKTDVNYLLSMQSLKRTLCILLSKSLLVFFVVTASKVTRKKFDLLKKYVFIMCIYSVFLLVSLFVVVELNMNNKNQKTEIFLTMFFGAAMAAELYMFYFIIKTGESYEERQKIQLIEMKNNMLQKSLEETEQTFTKWRQSVHDYKNTVIALRQLANDGDMDKIREYLGSESELVDRKLFYIRTGSEAVDTIVNIKQNYAEERGIVFVVNVNITEQCNIGEIDMVNILGNLIDNAIEASVDEKEPYIELTIKQEKSFILIKVVNKYSREFSGNMETKKKDKIFHGIGIGSVNDIVKKYDGDFSIDKMGDEVIAKIIIPNM